MPTIKNSMLSKRNTLFSLLSTFCACYVFTYAQSNPKPVKVAGGAASTIVLLDNGTVRTWGSNRQGQLGNSSVGTGSPAELKDSKIPVKVIGLENVTDISAGSLYNLALTQDGLVYGWGNNGDGEIRKPQESVEHIQTPVKLNDLAGVAKIATGGSATFVTLEDGQVLARGFNKLTPDWRNFFPIKALDSAHEIDGGVGSFVVLLNDGTVRIWGRVDGKIEVIKGLSNVVSVSAGGEFFLALLDDATVWACGKSNVGQFGNGSKSDTFSYKPVQVQGLRDVVEISAGNEHALALLKDGTVRAWGWNAYGQLGDGTKANAKFPVIVKGLMNVVHVGTGQAHSMAILEDGTLKTWGSNNSGQLGNGTTKDSSLPVMVKLF